MHAIVRPARLADLPRLNGLIEHVDPGMLTMPQTPEAMEERVKRSIAAFARASGPPDSECYFLVMEEAGDIVGTASVFTNIGAERPFYSYRISRDSKVSPEQKVKVELDILHLVNDYHGATELGTLFLLPHARGGGRGRLLSYARLMLIAADPVRFGDKVMAEIRGWTDDKGSSPFWEAVGRNFFRMDYRVADRQSARDHRFIADLMPRYPIYADLLPQSARDVIGKPHKQAEAAVQLLKAVGFHFDKVVDIFDAGPCVEAFVGQIDIVRDVDRVPGSLFAAQTSDAPVLVAADSIADFRAAEARPGEPRVDTLARLKLGASDSVLVAAMPEHVR